MILLIRESFSSFMGASSRRRCSSSGSFSSAMRWYTTSALKDRHAAIPGKGVIAKPPEIRRVVGVAGIRCWVRSCNDAGAYFTPLTAQSLSVAIEMPYGRRTQAVQKADFVAMGEWPCRASAARTRKKVLGCDVEPLKCGG